MGISEKDKSNLGETLKQLNLTNQEVDKFSKAFKDPEFIKLFEEYAKEVSDPKVKEETDLYLRQLEAEGRGEDVYGKGVMLVVPTEAFVIKTKDKSTGQKAFINICTSEKLDKLTMESKKGPDGKPGRHVEIPLSLSHKKTGVDKGGKPAWIWDFVVHPDTVEMAHKTPAIKKLLVETALEQIRGAHQVVLSDDYKLLNMKYKGTPEAPKPHVLSVRTNNTEGKPAEPGSRIRPVGNAPGVEGMPEGAQFPPAQASGSQGASQPGALKAGDDGKGAGGRSAFKFPGAKDKASKASGLASYEPGYTHESGEVTPQWELIHRGQVDLTECWGDSGRALSAAPPSYPEQLVLRLHLPGCTSAAAVELEVNRQNVSVLLPGKFKLESSLPFPVDDTKGKAKFDKTKQQLEVLLPTVPPPPTPTPPMAPKLVSDLTGGSDDVDGGAGGSGAEEDEWVVVPPSPGNQVDLDKEGGEGASGGDGKEGEMTENERKWLELHRQEQERVQKEQAAQEAVLQGCGAVGGGEESSGVSSEEELEEVQEFEASSVWAGARPGRVFKKGVSGLGYYRDVKAKVEQAVHHQAGGKAEVGARPAAAATSVQLKPRLHSTFADDLD